MNKFLIDLLPVMLLVIVCIGLKPMKPITKVYGRYLSIVSLKYYKGLFAIVIVFHHLSLRTETGAAFRLFSYVGYLAVAAFFFYSGYGLQKSYMTKGETYRKNFLKKRIPSVLIPYIAVTILYWAMKLAEGKFYTIKDIISAIIKGSPIVSNSWYIITIIIFYFAYWILMITCKDNYYAMLVGGGIWYVIYTFCCMKLGFSAHWYNTPHVLMIGMLWAMEERKLTETVRNHQVVIPLVWLAFIMLFVSKKMLASQWVELVIEIITAVFFAISVELFSMKVKIGNRILGFLGKISFEIYMIHGLFMTVLRGNHIYIENEFVWAILVLTLTIISGCVLHSIFNKLLTMYKRVAGV